MRVIGWHRLSDDERAAREWLLAVLPAGAVRESVQRRLRGDDLPQLRRTVADLHHGYAARHSLPPDPRASYPDDERSELDKQYDRYVAREMLSRLPAAALESFGLPAL